MRSADHAHKCDVCKGEFPCWDTPCIIGPRFICDDCTDDSIPFEKLLQQAAYETDPVKRQELTRRINEHCEQQPRGVVSTDSFDLFSGTPDERAIWLEAVIGLDEAKDRLRRIAAESPGPYFIFHAPSQTVLSQLQ